MKKYDLIVIGAGSAGAAAANQAARLGAKVLVVEKVLPGGTCVHRGCVPKKITWYAAGLKHDYENYAEAYGISEMKPQRFYEAYNKLCSIRDQYVKEAKEAFEDGFKSLGVDLIYGQAVFKDKHTIQVDEVSYQADQIIIATGGKPRELKIEGASFAKTSDDFFNLKELPKSIAIIGGGYIATELAMLLNTLGVQVHMILKGDRLLRGFEQTLVDTLEKIILDSGISISKNTHLQAIREVQNIKILEFSNHENLTVDFVLAAIGRVPQSRDLGLEAIGVEIDSRGFIVCNNGWETSVSGIYAIGDVKDLRALTPVAIAEGRRLSNKLFDKTKQRYQDAAQYEPLSLEKSIIPSVLFSHPPLASVGLTSEEAIKSYGDAVKVYKSSYNSMQSAVTSNKERVSMVMVTLGKEERVIGLHVLGLGADEMIQGFAVALSAGATKADFDRTIAVHPSNAEEFIGM